ncbi:hypothetical protein T03_4638 [Trichinella britovi]|uniref:Uncharacterized protein n=1 Tax=Trichinella britovi TaxID=45882 RepID=A0A0V1C3W9_TRIBR|nr:hypothetical protein T03_4638 [Trichinella britovi]
MYTSSRKHLRRHKNGWSTSVRKDDRTEVCFIAAESRLTLIKGLSSPRLEFMAALLRSRLIIYAKRELAMSIPHSDRCVESARGYTLHTLLANIVWWLGTRWLGEEENTSPELDINGILDQTEIERVG